MAVAAIGAICACNQAVLSWHRHCYPLGDARFLATDKQEILMKLSMQTIAVAVALAFAGSAYAQQPTTRTGDPCTGGE
jgi:hypothetical protein